MSALLPRLQGAQDIARDTSRQTALSQLQWWIVAYYSLNGKWPKEGTGTRSGSTTGLEKVLRESNIMNSIPLEPNENNKLSMGSDGNKIELEWTYYYEYMRKNGTDHAGLLLVAKTETPGKSNYICSKLPWTDLKDINYCKKLALSGVDDDGVEDRCKAGSSNDYCYVLVY